MLFSVLMSVYKSESPNYFRAAIDSVLNQSVKPDEIVLIRDGKVPDELQSVIDEYVSDPWLFTYVPLEENGGLGKALNIGVQKARNEIIARMDTDDLCVSERFAIQIAYLEKHPKISVIGSQIEEFIGDVHNVAGKRAVPCEANEINVFLKKRNPFNHMTVMFRKSDVLKAGNYQDMHYVEDYYLWCKMHLNGCVFTNLPQTLVRVRISADTYQRRGGYRYFCSWKSLEKFKYENKITRMSMYLSTLCMRFTVQVLMTNKLRGWILRKFSRVRTENSKYKEVGCKYEL